MTNAQLPIFALLLIAAVMVFLALSPSFCLIVIRLLQVHAMALDALYKVYSRESAKDRAKRKAMAKAVAVAMVNSKPVERIHAPWIVRLLRRTESTY